MYVNMTDKALSGWGKASGKSFYCAKCETEPQAYAILKAARERSEMVRISYSDKPRRGGTRDHVTVIHFRELGGLWLAYYRTPEEEAEADRRHSKAIEEYRACLKAFDRRLNQGDFHV